MTEVWEDLEEFPGYAISTWGNVMNLRSERYRAVGQNSRGIATVTLFNKERVYTRSVAVLVAKTFIPEDRDGFETPINLNGDRMNNRVDNLLWRPRPFAIAFHKQFDNQTFRRHYMPMIELNTGDLFDSGREPAIRFGLIFNHILMCCHNETSVFPTLQRFRFDLT